MIPLALSEPGLLFPVPFCEAAIGSDYEGPMGILHEAHATSDGLCTIILGGALTLDGLAD